MIKLIQEMILPYPKSVLLFLVGIIDLAWFLSLIFRKRYKTRTERAYFIFSFCVLAWVLGNAYAESAFFTYFGGNGLRYTFSFVGSFTTFSLIAFYYLSSLLRYRKKEPPVYIKVFVAFLVIQNIFFFFFSNIAIEQANVFPDGSFVLLQGKYFFIYYVIMIITILLGVNNILSALLKSKKEKNPIENRRLLFVGLGSSIMYANSIVFHMIYPYLTSDYSFSFIPPLFSVLDMVIVGYGVYKRRFISIRFYSLNLIKKVISLGVSVLCAYLFHKAVQLILIQIPLFSLIFLTVLFAVFLYNFVHKLLNSHRFYQLFGVSDTEHFRGATFNLKERNKVYTSVIQLENDLKKALSTKSRPIHCHIIPINHKNRSLYPHLVKYFKNHQNILVTEEIRFVESEQESLFPFLEELESLGGVCLPLFSPSKELVGLFTLGGKKYDHLYSKEEIEALENMGSYLSMVLNDILYSSELKKQVKKKTLELRQKIQEMNELVQQQSDFIAVTAHEFRTPLSIAMFQVEDIVQSLSQRKITEQDLEIVQSSLINLKDLTKKLFDVQQYDLQKVKVKKSKIELKTFIHDIYRNFLGLMEEKQMHFKLVNKLKKGFYFEIDAPQLRQVLHNLLTNAYKFTPKKGTITLYAQGDATSILIKVIDNGKGIPKAMKKVVFNKFRTNNKGAGIGLGLYICKKIVELHGGRLWVEDTPNGGATFCIHLENKS